MLQRNCAQLNGTNCTSMDSKIAQRQSCSRTLIARLPGVHGANPFYLRSSVFEYTDESIEKGAFNAETSTTLTLQKKIRRSAANSLLRRVQPLQTVPKPRSPRLGAWETGTEDARGRKDCIRWFHKERFFKHAQRTTTQHGFRTHQPVPDFVLLCHPADAASLRLELIPDVAPVHMKIRQ